jgi:hypothetical protein
LVIAENKNAARCRPDGVQWSAGLFLVSPGVLLVQRFSQTTEVRIEADKTTSLEERFAASVMSQAVERTLAVANGQVTTTRQTN